MTAFFSAILGVFENDILSRQARGKLEIDFGKDRFPQEDIYELLSPETQELTEGGGGGIKQIARRPNPLTPLGEEPAPLQPYNSTPPAPLAAAAASKL